MNRLISRVTSTIKSKAKTLHLLPMSFNVNSSVVALLPICEIVGGGIELPVLTTLLVFRTIVTKAQSKFFYSLSNLLLDCVFVTMVFLW